MRMLVQVVRASQDLVNLGALFVGSTLLTENMDIAQSETFGPVMAVMLFDMLAPIES